MERSDRIYRICRRILCAFILPFHRVRVSGMERLPDGAMILCPNHSTFADPLYLICTLPRQRRLYPLAKAELLKVPLIRTALKSIGTIFIDRGAADVKAVKTAMQVLKQDRALLIFPEGTRTKNGLDRRGQPVQPKEGAALFATRTGAPLVPVYISPGRSLFGTVRVIFGEPYHPEFEGRKATAQELTAITQELMGRVFALGGAAK